MSERQNIEWKSSWRDEYLQWICAFANTEGGTLIIGKDDKGKVVGLQNPKRLMEDLPSKIKAHLGIISTVNLLEDDGDEFIEIIIRPYSNAISYKGKFYTRSGSTTHELNGVELSDFLLRKSGRTWDEIIVEDATIGDIDEKSLQGFLADCTEVGRLPDTSRLNTTEILEKLHLAKNGQLKRAAIVLFGKDPNAFFSNVQVRIGRFGEDNVDLRFYEIIEGNLVYTLVEVQKQLDYKFLKRSVKIEGMKRKEEDEYPLTAMREILLNALVHKKYGGASIQVRVFDNQISIWNEGQLPSGWTEENLLTTHSSRPYNPLIAKACFAAGYIETWGTGTLRIIKACEDAGHQTPSVKVKDGGIEWTMWNKNTWQTEDGEDLELVSGRVNSHTRLLTKRQKEILNLIKVDKKLSRRKLAKILEINVSAVQSHIDILKEKGVLIRRGGTRGHWEVLNGLD